MKRKGTLIAISLSILLTGTYLGVGNYFYDYAINAKEEKEFLEDNPHLERSEAIDSEAEAAAWQADKAFYEQNPPDSMSIVSQDDLALKLHADAYANEAAGEKWAIVLHGYTSRALGMLRWIRGFHEGGYNVLAPDLRGHGESEGDYIGMGWPDRMDLLAWIDELVRLHPDAEIVLFGVSMGGATVMMASGEELPDNVKVIVEDCGYSSVSGVFTYQLDDLFGLPEFPVLNAANTVTGLRAGYDLYQASAVEQVAKSETPMLFIHGDEDTFVPYEMVNEVYEAASVEKEKLIIPGAGHAEAVMVDPELYWNTVWSFVGRHIN